MLYMLLTLTVVVACYIGITGYACTTAENQDWDERHRHDQAGATGDSPPG